MKKSSGIRQTFGNKTGKLHQLYSVSFEGEKKLGSKVEKKSAADARPLGKTLDVM